MTTASFREAMRESGDRPDAKVRAAFVVIGLGHVSAASAQRRFAEPAFDMHTRSVVPIPASERALQTAVAEPWFKVSNEGLLLEGAIFDRSCNLLFCDVSERRVLRLTPDQQLSTVVTLDTLSPGGLAFNPNGRPFIAALGIPNRRGAIYSANPGGSGLQIIVPPVAGYMPNDLVFDARGDFYFTYFKSTATESRGGVYYAAQDWRPSNPCCPTWQWPMAWRSAPTARRCGRPSSAATCCTGSNWPTRPPSRRSARPSPTTSSARPQTLMRADADDNVCAAIYGQGHLLALNRNGIPIGQVLLPGHDGGHNLTRTSLAETTSTSSPVTWAKGKGQGARGKGQGARGKGRWCSTPRRSARGCRPLHPENGMPPLAIRRLTA
ncbi:SMP-30/gluconolactonase/LRE family protein [Ideonella azotifigens]|nr:SMP-30/gluconolactonase/LRE family protein [Ideonella azotifigens]MCD2341469.1 SMP-30/gluconolactonase/LRE family protein [Ideonella azotifigens]